MLISDVVEILLKNRGLKTDDEISEFFSPPRPLDIPLSRLGWDKQPALAVDLVNRHLSAGNPIAIYGDYDVDGITSAAILWETLHRLSAHVFPYIPHRRREGYGLTRTGIDNCLEKGAKLIIVADSGITAAAEIAYCKSRGCDILIIDHHQPPPVLPEPDVLLYSNATSAAGLSWFFAREIIRFHRLSDSLASELLSLAAISVICDLVPLLGINRSMAKFGLSALNLTTRPGLLALFTRAGIRAGSIGAYEVGYVIGPRLNAMGRLEHALDSLRLLCTTDLFRASTLAGALDDTNRLRQELTDSSVKKAIAVFADATPPPVIVVADADFDEGIIGLIAAKLVEEYYRPSLVISVGPQISKGSGRSVSGFHLTDFLRQNSQFLQSVGGHEMAAGFSLLTSDLDKFTSSITASSGRFNPDNFVRTRRIDADIPISLVGEELYQEIDKFSPFGLGNPRPVFSSSAVSVSDARWIGRGASHLKFTASGLEAIYFQAPLGLKLADTVSRLIYSVDKNTYNGYSRLQLLVKEIHGPAA